MSTVAIGMPVFAGNNDNDLDRFFELYKDYIHSIGMNPSAVAGNPAGWENAMGMLCACLTGSAARWYDSNILGKRIKLRNILLHAANGDETTFKALAGNAANCPVNTWVNPSSTRNIMAPGGVDANVLVTNVWPDYAIKGNRDIWLNCADMKFTNDPLNYNVVGDAAGVGIAIAGEASAGHPYVILAYSCHVLIKMRNEFPTQQNARFRRSAEPLGYGNNVLVNQFLRGLNDDCAIEAERIGAERDIKELVGFLKRVKKRKAKLRLGRKRQENICYQRDRQIIPEQLPPKLYAYDSYPDNGPNSFDEDRDDDMHLQQVFDVASRSAPRNTLEQRLAGKIAKKIAKARERREDAELNRAMRELFLDDHDDPMDTSNTIRGVPIELVQDENGKIMLVQKKR
ncbi:hypothetical protein RclHR1_03440017 [Rhizophagus clarus]|uniref:Uncharacterized protein n=1 Tax=Rhizophagus clarus TaxID=94130 RepID=A0A2Z6RLW6_9GLOM|nr:hypothetical protein RclHR1_03440017 [Rhizophagus clarus]